MQTQIETPLPQVSVVVSTRNRGALVYQTIRSLLANTHESFEVILVDQSDNALTRNAVNEFQGDPRFSLISSTTKGLSRSRNIGLEAARADIVLMTDDDCEVPPDWIGKMQQVFLDHPAVGMVYCNVLVGPFDADQGFIPGYTFEENKQINSALEPGFGLGAGMALRRSVALRVGGFDPLLCAGGKFKSGDEHDITYRILLHGYTTYCTRDTYVVHYGFRTHSEGRRLVAGYMTGYGAVLAKLVKCGYWQGIAIYLRDLWLTIIWPVLLHFIRHRRIFGLRRLLNYQRGFVQGLLTPVDRVRECYRSSE